MQSIEFGAMFYNLCTLTLCEDWIPLSKLPALRELQITLCGLETACFPGGSEQRQERTEDLLRSYLVGTKVSFRSALLFRMWLKKWWVVEEP